METRRKYTRRHTFAERFHAKVDRSGGPDACWPWTGCRLPKGYGQIMNTDTRIAVRAHRLALEISTGCKIPIGMLVCHCCNNPPCCNPAHLYVGTDQDNMNDMVRDSRWRGLIFSGADNPRAKIREQDVREIRRLAADGVKQIELSRMFKIANQTISKIVNRQRWANVD